MCSFVVKDKMYLVGGEDNTAQKNGLNFMRQAWSIENCAFRREKDLPFDFDSGRCTSMAARSKAMLCSGIQRPKSCWIYDSGFFFFHSTFLFSIPCHIILMAIYVIRIH